MIKNCKNCEEEFSASRKNQIYCSIECKHEFNNNKYRKETDLNGSEPITNGLETDLNGLKTVSKPINANSNDYFYQRDILRLEKEKDKLERKNEALEKDNKELSKANDNLSLELRTKDKEHELEKKKEDSERKSGLNGLIDNISKNEGAVNSLVGLITAKLAGAPPTQALSGTESEEQDPHVLQFKAWFPSLDEKTKESIWGVLMALANHNDIVNISQKIINGIQKNAKASK